MRQVKVTRLFEETVASKKPVIVHRGGARSTKSYSILQYLIWRMTNEPNCQILITRKTMPALKLTAYKVFIELLKEYGYYQYCSHSLTNNSLIYRPNGAFVAFLSIDNPERIKSSEWNVIHMEEANEYNYSDYQILKTRLSAPTETQNKLILSMNPVDAFHWVKLKVIEQDPENVEEIVSNYKDNPFLSAEYVKSLKDLANIDRNFHKIYTLGEWGSLDNVIYNNWEAVDKFPVPERTIWGCDFGFRVPTAVVEIGLKDDAVYIRQHLYDTDKTNEDLIAFLKATLPPGAPIYCDAAEPARIEEMKRADIYAISADKSVKDGIDFVKRQNLKIHSSSVDIVNEIRAYSNKIDKNGNAIDEPIKMNDHALDAIRYALYTHLGKRPDYEIIS